MNSARRDELFESWWDRSLSAVEMTEWVAALQADASLRAWVNEQRSFACAAGLQLGRFDSAGLARRVSDMRTNGTSSCRRRLVRRVRGRRRRFISAVPVVALAAALLLLGSLAVFGLARSARQPSTSETAHQVLQQGVQESVQLVSGDSALATKSPLPLDVEASAVTRIVWNDGTWCELDPGGHAVFERVDGSATARVLAGVARCSVQPQPSTQPFVVSSEDCQVIVLGTLVSLELQDAGSVVRLERGAVRVVAGDGQSMQMVAGQSVLASRTQGLRLLGPAAFVDDFTADQITRRGWFTGRHVAGD
ncbi:MAG: FecR domain-containing protein [Planctomycetota bacterium]|jgi:hypothetical protein|nr:FecR domain-containing protein [Planctomycetota bacterium]